MKMKALVLTVLLTSLALSAPAVAEEEITDTLVEKITGSSGGDVVIQELETDGVKGLRATFTVEHPRDVVYATINDLGSFMKLFPNILSYKVVKDHGASRDIFFKVDAVLMEAEYTLRRTAKRGRTIDTISWNRLSGDCRVIRGAWVLAKGAKPGTTKVIYQSFVDVAMVVPTGMVRSMAISKVKEMVGRVREGSDVTSKKEVGTVKENAKEDAKGG